MCKAKDYAEQLLEIYNNINNEHEYLTKEFIKENKYQQDVLHMIENNKFSASKGYELAKMLQDNRVRRRKIKNELTTLEQLKTKFINKNINALNSIHQSVVKKDIDLTNRTENKIYTPRIIGKTLEINNVKPDNNIIIQNTQKVNNEQKTRHKNTNEEIQILHKIDDKLYLVRRKDGRTEVMRKTLILNLNENNSQLQIAK